jgi:mitochondrial import inner membrane translocase subunit TIM50
MSSLRNIKAEGFPYITASLLSLGIGVGLAGVPHPGEGRDPLSYLKRAAERVSRLLRRDESMPVLPPQKEPKPVVLFDQDGVLSRRTFSLFDLDFLYTRRPFSDLFLFHTAHLYELVSVSGSVSSTSREVLRDIDPYGCISYKIFCGNKRLFNKSHLSGRPLERLVVLATRESEYHEDFRDNVLNIGGWDGSSEGRLLDLINFLYNLHFAGITDFRGTIRSYTGKDFFTAFSAVQRRLFRSRNMFQWNTDAKYEARVREINETRMKEYAKAKAVMDRDLKRESSGSGDIFGLALRMLLSL